MSLSITVPVLQKYPNDAFVETGTFEGGGIVIALNCGCFKDIYSVEVHKPYYDNNVQQFRNLPNVHLFLGDSAEVLWTMIKDIDVPITFWLDGHICLYPGVAVGKKNIPILEELQVIAQHPIKTHTILVDDRRVMGTGFGYGWEVIPESMVIEHIKKINLNYVIRYEDSLQAPKDIVVGVLP
jgi:hypothetical protein